MHALFHANTTFIQRLKRAPIPPALSLQALIDLELDEFNTITTVTHEELRGWRGGGIKRQLLHLRE